jgi:Arginase family.
LLEKLSRSGKKIRGFDLVEVAPGEINDWDANVGARLLYKLCLYANNSIK